MEALSKRRRSQQGALNGRVDVEQVRALFGVEKPIATNLREEDRITHHAVRGWVRPGDDGGGVDARDCGEHRMVMGEDDAAPADREDVRHHVLRDVIRAQAVEHDQQLAVWRRGARQDAAGSEQEQAA